MKIGDLNMEIKSSSTLPNGSECQLKMVSLKLKVSESGTPYLLATLEPITEDPTEMWDYIYHRLFLPMEDDDQRRAAKKVQILKEFCEKFNIDFDELVKYVYETEGNSEAPRFSPSTPLETPTARVKIAIYEGIESNAIQRWVD